ncbi:MAG: isoamylase [Spirochaetota bacterium]
MKRFVLFFLLILFYSILYGLDMESFRFVDHLLSIKQASSPEIYEDAVIFTFPSTSRRVGVAFAHEGFSNIHWFKKLMKSENPPDTVTAEQNQNKKTKNSGPVYIDSGVLFYVYEFPEGMKELQYRLIIDGLWITDPNNPKYQMDPSTGIMQSIVTLPDVYPVDIEKKPVVYSAPSGSLRFMFDGDPGQRVTVAGTFNNWDPFMYTLPEIRPGHYELILPLAPGTYRYVFIYKGERVLDPNNPKKVYTREGYTASEAVVK